MRKSIVLITIVLFCSSSVGCQKVDSLLHLLEPLSGLDSEEKTAVYLELAKLHRRTDPGIQLEYARKAFTTAQETHNNKSQGISLSEIASHYQKADNYDSAYYYYEKAKDFFESERNIGNTYSRLSTVEKSRGNFVESIRLLIKADSLFERANFNKGRLITNTNLGILLSTQGEYNEAIKYYKRAESQLGSKDERNKSILYSNFAITYNQLGDLSNSEKYVRRSIAIKQKLKDQIGLANSYVTLSVVVSKQGNYSESIRYLEQALSNFKKMNSKSGQAGCYNGLGESYRLLGNYDKAEEYLNLAKGLAEEIQNHETLLSNNKEFYELYQAQQLWDKAFLHLQDYNNLKDSITEIDKIKISKELVTKYGLGQLLKDKEIAERNIALAEQKAEYNKVFAITLAALGAFILMLGIFFFYRYKTKKKEEALFLKLRESERHLKLEQQTRVSELKALRSQMNPHFIFNALNSIQDLILLNDVRSSNRYLGKFGDLMRRILRNSDDGFITVTEELKTLKLYAELEQLRFGERLKIEFKNELSEEISDTFLIPVMIIQPVMENSLKHGLLHKSEDKQLSIHFYQEESMIVCVIDDNGIGREEALKIKSRGKSNHLGFSTQAIQERINLLNTERNEKIKIEIVDKKDEGVSKGTTVFLFFPFTEL